MSSRTRSRGSFICETGNGWSLWGDCTQTQFTISSTYPLAPVGSKETMTDEVIPGFHKRRASGEVFFNVLHHTRMTASAVRGSPTERMTNAPITCGGIKHNRILRGHPGIDQLAYRLWNNGYAPEYNSSPYVLDLLGSDIDDCITEAVTSCLSNRGKHKDSNLYETLAEIDKSASMVDDLLRQCRKFVLSHKTGGQFLPAASVYLMYRYGLLPLLGDVDSVIAGLQKKTGRVRETSRGFANLSRILTETKTNSYSSGSESVTSTFTDAIQVRAMSLDEYVATLGGNLGFRTKGLLTLPWELIPFSFVVDWVVNVGDYFGALVPAVGYSSLGGCVVQKRTQTWNAIAAGATSAVGYTQLQVPSGSYHVTKDTVIRSPSLPAPGLVIKSDFRLDSLTRVGDSVALLLQALLGGKLMHR